MTEELQAAILYAKQLKKYLENPKGKSKVEPELLVEMLLSKLLWIEGYQRGIQRPLSSTG